ncbi:hypothetical protein [Chryseobacterium sp.]|uniref:hypothetical protein n=1 Tax=Chryseobacterium sp. TaxID=1871047 RepID=UPI00321AAEB6
MSNTKYKKVAVSERLPEKTGIYFVWIDHPNADTITDTDYYNLQSKQFKSDGRFNSFYDVTHWLEEVTDYEEEMREMLDRIQDLNILPEEIEDELALLLKKIKS